jgi:tRNA (cmo5U34)-methyltransferase
MKKSTPDEIRARFDEDVERFANLETGQAAAIDSPLMMELVAGAAAAASTGAGAFLDVGCGAGNYAIKLLQKLPDRDVTLVDLSRPMLDRAVMRIGEVSEGKVEAIQGDVRDIDLGKGRFDVILAAMTLHHLRSDEEWRAVFAKFFEALKPGGSAWIADMVSHEVPAVHELMWRRYGEYLAGLKDEAYRDHVFAYIDREDTPRSLTFQLDLLRDVGFGAAEVLHKSSCFAAFGAVKSGTSTSRDRAPESWNDLPR